MIAKYEGLSNKLGYALVPHAELPAGSTGKPAGLIRNSAGLAIVAGSSTLSTTQWTHLALTSDGTNLRLYVNGVLATTNSALTAPVTTADLIIGGASINPPMAGTWNIFTQLHHLKDENELLGCPEGQGGGVPISFNVRHYKAGAHKNPGFTEIATPVEGDYIEVGFNGGEMNTECEAVNDTKSYVIAPLEHGRW